MPGLKSDELQVFMCALSVHSQVACVLAMLLCAYTAATSKTICCLRVQERSCLLDAQSEDSTALFCCVPSRQKCCALQLGPVQGGGLLLLPASLDGLAVWCSCFR